MRFVLVLVLIAAAAAGGYYVASTRAAAPAPVRTVVASRGSISVTVDLTGSVTAKRSRGLTFGTAGTIASVKFAEGDRVMAQAVIAQLDTTAIDAQMAAAQSALTSAKSALRAARDAQGAAPSTPPASPAAGAGATLPGSTATSSQLSANIDAAQAAVDAAEAQIQAARLAQTGAVITAPFDGIVTRMAFHAGDYVSAGLMLAASTFPIEVADVGALQVLAGASEDDVVKLAVGQAGAVTFDALPSVRLSSHVCEIPVSPTPLQGVPTYPIKACLDGTDPAVRLGLTASLKVEVAQRSDVLLVPASAIHLAGDRHEVTVVGADGRLVATTVVVGESDSTNTEIISGLAEGDRIQAAN
jgi:RND family efflux transporter MFP subunit